MIIESDLGVTVVCDDCSQRKFFTPLEYYEFFEKLKLLGWDFLKVEKGYAVACPGCPSISQSTGHAT